MQLQIVSLILIFLLNSIQIIVATIDEAHDFIERRFLTIHKHNIGGIMQGYEMLLEYGINVGYSSDEIKQMLTKIDDFEIYQINNICNLYCYEVLNNCANGNQKHYEEECFVEIAINTHNLSIEQIEMLSIEKQEFLIKRHWIAFLASLVILRNALASFKNSKI